MKLSRLIVIILFLFLFTESNAQRCYYRSFQDLDSGRSVQADFRMQRLSVRKLRRHLGPEYRLKCGLHTKRKILNNALFVQVDSELFVNGRKLLSDDVSVGKGFAPCMRVGNDRVAFISVRRDRALLRATPSMLEDIAFPDDDYNEGELHEEYKVHYKPDGAYVEKKLADDDDLLNRVAYALDRKSKARRRMAKIRSCYFLFKADPTDARIVDARYMRYLLAPYPGLQEQYMKLDPASREDPIVIWQYLRQIR